MYCPYPIHSVIATDIKVANGSNWNRESSLEKKKRKREDTEITGGIMV